MQSYGSPRQARQSRPIRRRATRAHSTRAPDRASASVCDRGPDDAACCVVHSADTVRDPDAPAGPGRSALPHRPRGTRPRTRGRTTPTGRASPHMWTHLWTTWGAASVGTPAADDLWAKVAAAVRAQLSEATWNTWFQGVHALDLTDDTLVLGVPSSVTIERIRTSYLGLLDRRRPGAHRRPARRLAARRHRAPARGAGRRSTSSRRRPAAAAPGRRAPAASTRPTHDRGWLTTSLNPALHVRPVRHRRVEPLRPRRRAVGRREPGPVVQPAVHLRAGRARQDPPAARDRPPRARRCSRASGSATSRPRR